MKSPISYLQSLISISLILTGLAHADLPRKAPLQTYSGLWNNSPFTSKPPIVDPVQEANPLEDYALIGIAPIGGSKYRVTMINKKEPDKRVMVYSDKADSDYKILGVTRKPGNPLGTVVSMSYKSMTGTVSFDEKLLTLAAPKAAPPVNGQVPIPGRNPQVLPGQPPIPGQNPQINPGGVQRTPRPRVVPPPTPVPGQAPQPGQPVPQVNQSPLPQQPQPQNIQQQERPERRRN